LRPEDNVQLTGPLTTAARRLPHEKQLDTLFIWTISAALCLHAALRGTRSDYDAEGYSIWYDRISSLSINDFLALLLNSGIYFESDLLFSFETGFAIFTFIISRISGSLDFFFLCCAALSLSLKASAIIKFCEKPLPGFLWYISWSYLLLEMTTIRAGIATGILMLGYGYLRDRRIMAFLLIVAAAMAFHASAAAAALLPLGLLAYRPRSVIIVLVLCIGLSFFSIMPVVELLSTYNDKLAEYYRLYVDLGLYEAVNRFNVVAVLRITLLLMTILAVRSISDQTSQIFMLDLSIFCFSIAVYYIFSSFPIIGGRLYELLGVFQIFLVSRLFTYKLLAPKLLAAAIITVQFYVLVFHVRFVDFFYFIGTPYNLESSHRL
jgi:EpsG family